VISLVAILAPFVVVLVWSTWSIVRGILIDLRERDAAAAYEAAYRLGLEYGRWVKLAGHPCPAVPDASYRFVANAPRRARLAMHEQNMRVGHARGLHTGWIGEAFGAKHEAARKARTALQDEVDSGLAQLERFANRREKQ
jgi:hypothetical protein